MGLSRWTVAQLATLAAAAAAAAAGCVVGTNAAMASRGSSVAHGLPAAPAATVASLGPDFPVNAQGMTYGSNAHATTVAQEPDLIAAVGKTPSGQLISGYVRKADDDLWSGIGLSGAAQIVAYQARVAQAGPVIHIPLYAQDGTTVIGQFSIDNNPATVTYASPAAAASRADRSSRTRR
jgi:hypothetical protein